MDYVGKTKLPSRAVCRTQGPRTCEAWSGDWPDRKLHDYDIFNIALELKTSGDLKNCKLPGQNIQYWSGDWPDWKLHD